MSDNDETLKAIAADAGVEAPAPITFELCGLTFTAIAEQPVGALMQMHRRKVESNWEAVGMIADIVEQWTIPEDRERLQEAFVAVRSVDELHKVIEHLTTETIRVSFGVPSPSSG